MRSFANHYARTLYSRDWLAAFFARQEGTTAIHQMRALQSLSRDQLIGLLRDIMRLDRRFGRRPSNSIRAAYIRERHARLVDRALLIIETVPEQAA
ncbi:hypothetical protein IZ6_10530 [Terrihabitans soli]|uniref:Uncharacterized protein n=1 Tax=Terrihabitans soli TaxID=708113 RepID=A0A6S6QUY4_9HYPH|nr:hypothetical protein [Terrihabitans soli]BCJ90318.1 hypothetical protein IZ6_10530 [Terrihabitans soli]